MTENSDAKRKSRTRRRPRSRLARLETGRGRVDSGSDREEPEFELEPHWRTNLVEYPWYVERDPIILIIMTIVEQLVEAR
jgi:hypothetical protein